MSLLKLFRKIKLGFEKKKKEKKKKKKRFYSELRLKLKDIFIDFGQDFK